MNSCVVRVFSRSALKANLGEDATNIWETRVVGYDVTLWKKMPDGCEVPEMTRFVKTENEARALAFKWRKLADKAA